jgi:hypothetical protein
MQTGSDGLVRLTLEEVLSTPLTHVLSGVDPELDAERLRCGTTTSITGYTEWQSARAPVIVMGWDWKCVCGADEPRLARVGAPRCNLILVDDDAAEVDWERQLAILGTVIDAMDWEHHTQALIGERYR